MDAKGITVRISTAEWATPAIERIAKMAEDLIEIGVPQGTVHHLCKEAITQLAIRSTTVEMPMKRMMEAAQDFMRDDR